MKEIFRIIMETLNIYLKITSFKIKSSSTVTQNAESFEAMTVTSKVKGM